jgi:hypothetical protein
MKALDNEHMLLLDEALSRVNHGRIIITVRYNEIIKIETENIIKHNINRTMLDKKAEEGYNYNNDN